MSQELVRVWQSERVFKTPESVNYYEKANCLFISNINGNPSEKDGNGFISKVTVDGNILNLRWVKGLNAPKGLAIYKETMVVADIDSIVIINILKGKVIKKVLIPDATFLNDVAVDDKGIFYISDSSVKSGKIYGFNGKKIYAWLSGAKVKSPNGLFVKGNFLFFGSWKDKTIYKVNIKTRKQEKLAFVNMGVDGLKMIKNNCFFISDWLGHVAKVCGDRADILLDTTREKINAADLEYIKDKNLLIIPTFFDDRCVAYKFK
jgi:sugar lactone lactonase YvrE